jgi:hypothetical protein
MLYILCVYCVYIYIFNIHFNWITHWLGTHPITYDFTKAWGAGVLCGSSGERPRPHPGAHWRWLRALHGGGALQTTGTGGGPLDVGKSEIWVSSLVENGWESKMMGTPPIYSFIYFICIKQHVSRMFICQVWLPEKRIQGGPSYKLVYNHET